MKAVVTPAIPVEPLHPLNGLSDRIAYRITRALRFFADTLLAKRYGNCAIVIETVAAVRGMVGGALLHLRCLRWMRDDEGWIRTLLEEADNERMHLMTFMEIARPSWFERTMVPVAHGLYIVSSRTAQPS